MDGQQNFNSEVTCCFCSEQLLLKDAAILNIQPNINSEEVQSFFCHKHHLLELINKSIPLHPDLFDNK